MNIRDTFLKLTSKTYPYGTERQLFSFLPKGIKQDLWGNYFYQIGDTKTIFACHLDTANKEQGNVNHVFDGDFIKTDGTSILGADDKAGVTILLWLLEHKIPGTYYFFIGEEVGCIGSGAAAKDVAIFSKFDRIISFDRRDTCSVITHQSWSRSCSDEFADALIEQIEKGGLCLKKDDGGVYTDSAEFVDIIPECTNLSVGYYSEHTHSEKQDIIFLESLCQCLLLVDWESLPTARDPKKTEYKSYTSDYDYGWGSSGNSIGQVYMKEYHNEANFYGMQGSEDYDYNKDNKPKKTRRSNKKRTKFDDYDLEYQFENFDDTEDEDEFFEDNFIDTTAKSFQYGILKELYFDDTLTEQEIEIIKDQYLDMSNPDDADFARHLTNPKPIT